MMTDKSNEKLTKTLLRLQEQSSKSLARADKSLKRLGNALLLSNVYRMPSPESKPLTEDEKHTLIEDIRNRHMGQLAESLFSGYRARTNRDK
jgi:hypothetical protein